MNVKLKADAKVLVPNSSHKNFTETDEILPAGIELSGNYKFVDGMRRGQPFRYRIFQTNDGKIIYSNFTDMTEVTLNADGPAPSKKIKITKCEFLGATILGGAAVAYAVHQKYSMKKTAIIATGGLIAGYFAGKICQQNVKTKF